MTRWLLLSALLGCGGADRYDNSLLELATHYRAKQMCSCLFVAGRDEAHCAAWTVASPDVASYRIDAESKTVHSDVFWLAPASYTWADEASGCRVVTD